MKKKFFYVALMMGATLLTGCLGDDNKKNDPIDVTITEGVVVVNNGSSYNGIDGSMSFIDLRNDAIQQNVYKTANGASLGGTPNDAIVYGQKLYVVGSDENTVFVLLQGDHQDQYHRYPRCRGRRESASSDGLRR